MSTLDTSPAALRALTDPREYADNSDVYAHNVEMRKILRAVADEKEAQGWQPFETAPKDGAWFLAWRRHGVMPIYARFVKSHGWYENDDGFHLDQATHWMRAPQGPKT